MPMHDWTRVDAGIYHDFHHESISEIKLRIEVIDRTYAAILAAKTPAERAWMIGDCHRVRTNHARRRGTRSPPDLDRAANLTCGLEEDRRWSRLNSSDTPSRRSIN